MAYNDVVTAIANAITDAKTLENVINGAPNVQFRSRLGQNIWTLATIGYMIEIVNQQANAAIVEINQDKSTVDSATSTALDNIQVASNSVQGAFNAKLNDLDVAINQAAAAGAGANGWVDIFIATASGRNQREKNSDYLTVKDFGLKGDGTNEYTKLKDLLDYAAANNKAIDFAGLTISTSPIAATGNLRLFGSGGLKLFAGSKGTLLTSNYNLEIGSLTLDQNKENNANANASTETDCTIKHTGENLILNGTIIKPSTSTNVVTRATKNIIAKDVEIDGGQICLYAISNSAKVVLSGGVYKNAANFDNIQILGVNDVTVSGVTSFGANRSGIVVGNSTGKVRIFGNYCYNNRTDYVNQGGWGIVCSINTQNAIVALNVCVNNQRGGITIDTYPESGATVDNRIVVVGNVVDGAYNNGYATTGIALNDADHATVVGNQIYKVAQGMLCVDANYANITSNTIQDTSAYFVQFLRCHNSVFNNNICDTNSGTGAAALIFIDSDRFNCRSNTITNLTGASGFVFRVSGATKDWDISDNKVSRMVTGSGYVFHVLGASNTGGRITRNRIKADGVTGWQWYLVSDNNTVASSFDNVIDSASTSYITSGANITAGDDTVNGSKNTWSSNPTTFKSVTGQLATIAGVIKSYNGTAWTTTNTVTTTYDPPSIAAGASVSTNIAVQGAVLGDIAQASFSIYNANIEVTAAVSGTNQVTVKFKNTSASAVDLASGTIAVKII